MGALTKTEIRDQKIRPSNGSGLLTATPLANGWALAPRLITTAHVAALKTQAQMYPSRAGSQATPRSRRASVETRGGRDPDAYTRDAC